jgi:tetratricopeptide (TPR) repeat protein
MEYQTALYILPDYPDAIENYAMLESRMGHDQDALRLFQRALYVTPRDRLDYAWMVVNLAVQLAKLGQNDEALNLLNQVIQQEPSLSPAWSNRAAIRRRKGEFQSARSDAETALLLDPTNLQAQFLLNMPNAPNAAVAPREGISSK